MERIRFGEWIDLGLALAGLHDPASMSPGRMIETGPRIGSTHLARLELMTPQGPFSIGDFRFDIDEGNSKFPERVSAALSGLRVDLTKMESSPGTDKVIAMGYPQVGAGAQFNLRWLPSERALVLENTGVMIDKAGRLDIAIRFADFDLTAAVAHPELSEKILSTARFESAQARVTDLGFADRFYADVAKNAGAAPDVVRTAVAADMRAQAILLAGPMLAPGSADALAQFLGAPARLTATLTARPGRPPVTLADLNRPDATGLQQRLLLTIKTPAN